MAPHGRMKVVYHPRYTEVYASDPAAAPGRMESICAELAPDFDFIEPEAASPEDLLLVHTAAHLSSVQRLGLTYEIALLAVGGAIQASRSAVSGEPAFALIRPPGHHASPNYCWGFCFFNNIAISVEKLRREGKISRALIIDIDLHYGDGTANIFQHTPQVSYFHVQGRDREEYLARLAEILAGQRSDILALSAGFDRHQEDWGGLLHTEDYARIGELVKQYAERVCEGRRYAVLEGGYNHRVLGKNVKALLAGMS
jgi:acetoin utilization deacetylase AcuC-like enzyme